MGLAKSLGRRLGRMKYHYLGFLFFLLFVGGAQAANRIQFPKLESVSLSGASHLNQLGKLKPNEFRIFRWNDDRYILQTRLGLIQLNRIKGEWEKSGLRMSDLISDSFHFLEARSFLMMDDSSLMKFTEMLSSPQDYPVRETFESLLTFGGQSPEIITNNGDPDYKVSKYKAGTRGQFAVARGKSGKIKISVPALRLVAGQTAVRAFHRMAKNLPNVFLGMMIGSFITKAWIMPLDIAPYFPTLFKAGLWSMIPATYIVGALRDRGQARLHDNANRTIIMTGSYVALGALAVHGCHYWLQYVGKLP